MEVYLHHTKDKGDLGVIKIMADLSEQGLKILTPISEHLPFDIVVFSEVSGKLYKVQVKYKAMVRGVVQVPLKTSFYGKTGSVTKRYKDDDFDIIAIYCPDINSCAYLRSEDIKNLSTTVTLRVEQPKVGVTGKVSPYIKMFKDYSCSH